MLCYSQKLALWFQQYDKWDNIQNNVISLLLNTFTTAQNITSLSRILTIQNYGDFMISENKNDK